VIVLVPLESTGTPFLGWGAVGSPLAALPSYLPVIRGFSRWQQITPVSVG